MGGKPNKQPSTSYPELVSNVPLSFPRTGYKLLKRIPRASKELGAKRFTSILDAVVDRNDHVSGPLLFLFEQCCFRFPRREKKKSSLASAVNNQIRDEASNIEPTSTMATSPSFVLNNTTQMKCKIRIEEDPVGILERKVSNKLTDGNFQGAVHLVCSEETIADYSDETYAALQRKHPAPHQDSVMVPHEAESEYKGELSEPVVVSAMKSFQCGSSGGSDGLRPQHIKDIISVSAGASGVSF